MNPFLSIFTTALKRDRTNERLMETTSMKRRQIDNKQTQTRLRSGKKALHQLKLYDIASEMCFINKLPLASQKKSREKGEKKSHKMFWVWSVKKSFIVFSRKRQWEKCSARSQKLSRRQSNDDAVI